MHTKDKLKLILDEADALHIGELESLELCKFLIKRNPRLLKDYVSLEDALKSISNVISMEIGL